MAWLYYKCHRCHKSTDKCIEPEPIGLAELEERTWKFIMETEEAHKRAAKSKLHFGAVLGDR